MNTIRDHIFINSSKISKHPVTSRYRRYSSTCQQIVCTRASQEIVSSQRMLIDPLQISKYQDITKVHHEDSSKPDIVTFLINVTNGHIIRPINKTR
ncbi:hypothetical protein GIB67_032011 [Kingdonia uniflora]|uniref:Uncharacterized protein n=1 Tax=Kingdonia uniflora TaxID=39325 RepID=A0A7J7MWU3_9MAGN|nr:hypothetical protein GIB67_032011 [Kingdonia uniflora]